MTVQQIFLESAKIALSAGTLTSYLSRRAAQGVGGASAVARAIPQGGTSRAAVSQLSPLNAHRLGAVRSAGTAQTAMQRAAANPVTQAMRQRVGAAWERSVTGAPGVRGTTALSPRYDYGATAMSGAKPMAYTKAHVNSVMGGSRLVDPKGIARSVVPPQPGGTSAASPRSKRKAIPFATTALAPMQK